jgi:hypothetical protein
MSPKKEVYIMRKVIQFKLVLLFALAMMVLPLSTAKAQDCGCMDVVFAIDLTGSMSGAINNVKAGAAGIVDDIVTASTGDYQLGVVGFKDIVGVGVDLAPGNAAAVEAFILALTASGGAGLPEASDEALNTIINGLDAADRPPGKQQGDFDGSFRAGCVKIIILVTDALPGGFDDIFTVGVDNVNAQTRANEAAAANIKISALFVPTAGDSGQSTIMMNYANTTGGVYILTFPDGTGTGTAIQEVIEGCGEPIVTCTKGFWKNHEEEWVELDPQAVPVWGGGNSYIQILWTPPKNGDASIILAHALIAAVLNTGAPVGTVADAADLLETHPVGSGDLEAKGGDTHPDRQVALDLAGILQEFNESLECPLP